MEKIKRFLKDEEGIEFVEWALMCSGFALVVAGGLVALSGGVTALYGRVTAALA